MFELRMTAPTDPGVRDALVFDPDFHDADALLERIDRGVVPSSALNDVAATVQRSVQASPSLRRYVMDLWDATHAPQAFGVRIDGVEMDRLMAAGASPRGMMTLMRAARVVAWLAGREHVVPDDVASVFAPAMVHRLFFSPLYDLRRTAIADALVAQILQRVPTPR